LLNRPRLSNASRALPDAIRKNWSLIASHGNLFS